MILIQSITKVLQTLFLEFPSVRILYAHICSTCTKTNSSPCGRNTRQGQKACLLRVEIFAENTTRCLDDGDKDIMGKGDSRIHR